MRKFLALFFLFFVAINYEAGVVKKFPQASCVKLGKDIDHPKASDSFFIAATPGRNPRWLSHEQSTCALAWQDAYQRNAQ